MPTTFSLSQRKIKILIVPRTNLKKASPATPLEEKNLDIKLETSANYAKNTGQAAETSPV
jgi:hypothetical protein